MFILVATIAKKTISLFSNRRSVIDYDDKHLYIARLDLIEGKYKVLQEEQRLKIEQLKGEVMRQRGQQTDKIQQIRADCLKEKQDFKQVTNPLFFGFIKRKEIAH